MAVRSCISKTATSLYEYCASFYRREDGRVAEKSGNPSAPQKPNETPGTGRRGGDWRNRFWPSRAHLSLADLRRPVLSVAISESPSGASLITCD